MTSKFGVGDYCYFDDDKGKVLAVQPSSRGEGTFNVKVRWDNNVTSWVWESDLLTQAEYDAFYEEL